MKDRIEGTIRVTPDQIKDLLREFVESTIRVPSNHFVDIRIGSLNEYSDSKVEFSIRHDDEREVA